MCPRHCDRRHLGQHIYSGIHTMSISGFHCFDSVSIGRTDNDHGAIVDARGGEAT
jgi:hypothetical protein